MNLPPFDYISPASLDEALAWLAESRETPVRILGGGTDLLVDLRRKVIPTNHRPPRDFPAGGRWTTVPAGEFRPPLTLLSLSRIPELKGIHEAEDGLHVGAMTTILELEESSLVREKLTALWDGAYQLGSPLVRSRGTIGGNICNARPAADALVPSYALDGRVRLQSANGERSVRVEEFVLAPGKTTIQPGEIMTEVIYPARPDAVQEASSYIKLANRKSLEIAVVGAAAWVRIGGEGLVDHARISLGAVGPTPLLARDAATALAGKPLDAPTIKDAARIAARAATPITDHRGGMEYRSRMVEVLVARALRRCQAALSIGAAA